MSVLRKLLTILLILILPVQGLAAALAPVHNAVGAPETTAMPCHEHADARHARQPAAGESTTGNVHDGDSTSHQCCHQVFTGATSSALPNAARKFSDVSRFVLPLYTLFIPDSPDRPPRG